ncbi:trichohyalin-like isoform X2 [Argopecten irradians]|uniref:trichohyalin-like isoform X2 n=1 Tax=Argopecten irradians TaxID=31199 RepID=UPI0037111EF5
MRTRWRTIEGKQAAFSLIMDLRKHIHKALRDACQTELSKQKRYIEKWQADTEKNLCQQENSMRQQLERLQQDKERYLLEAELKEQYQGKRRFSESDSERFRRHSFTSQLPKIGNKLIFNSKEELINQPRSHRQLRIASAIQAQVSQESIRGDSKSSVTRLPKIHKDEEKHQKDRRKSMPAVPTIVVTDYTCCPEEEFVFSHGTEKDDGHPLTTKTSDEKSQPLVDRRSSYQSPRMDRRSSDNSQMMERKRSGHGIERRSSHDRHDYRGSHQHLDRMHHKKSTDSFSKGRHIGHHDHMNDTEELTSLYDMAIQTVASANESAFTQVHDIHRRSIPNWKDDTKFPDAKQMDLSSLQELENMLRDARQYNTRKQKESDYGLHTAENRQQRRRLQFLEEILQALSGNEAAKFDPLEMLHCCYLRLSKSNIERLEQMVRESGIDPGIHAHSDVTDLDIWQELRDLRKREAEEKEQLQKEAAGRRSRQSIKQTV